MICPRCNKDLKDVRHRVDDMVQLVCGNCYKKWRRRKDPSLVDVERARSREYALSHAEQIKAYVLANPLKRKAIKARHYANHKEEARQYHLFWVSQNPDYFKNRYRSDPQFRLSSILRSRVKMAVKRGQKAGSAVRDLGCTVVELKVYLESKFQPGMAWENWGNGLGNWNLDHIKPLAKFDLTDRQQFLEACHFTNLQPLWWRENLEKSDKV